MGAQIIWFQPWNRENAAALRKEAGEARLLAKCCRDAASLRDLANYASALERAAVDLVRRAFN